MRSMRAESPSIRAGVSVPVRPSSSARMNTTTLPASTTETV